MAGARGDTTLTIADCRLPIGALAKQICSKEGNPDLSVGSRKSAIGNSKSMIIVNITGFLTDFTNGASGIELKSSPATVRQALDELWQLHVGLRDRVVTEQGQLRQHVNVFLNGENIRRKELLETKLADGGEITILPSVSGGEPIADFELPIADW